ncbi:hypothetical protein BpHYR1_028883 [Brachionus plicatilis]|uniref:Uncharacterized protein n=1 Tax=Brachionus plicatilis TaxID=10195 RepID=A0A3M7RAI4_BRAPC|nr:hypothetical protein BpHYR1_028883 [Brachionus plicatilis]
MSLGLWFQASLNSSRVRSQTKSARMSGACLEINSVRCQIIIARIFSNQMSILNLSLKFSDKDFRRIN